MEECISRNEEHVKENWTDNINVLQKITLPLQNPKKQSIHKKRKERKQRNKKSP